MKQHEVLIWGCRIDKRELIQAIVLELNNIKAIAVASAQQAHETATHSENIAESRYDTLGLEAAYLAHGQTQRVADCDADIDADIDAFKHLSIKVFSEEDVISVGALVCVQADDEVPQYLFLAPRAGGVKVLFQGVEVTLVTNMSPIGRALLGKGMDDDIRLVIGGSSKSMNVFGVF